MASLARKPKVRLFDKSSLPIRPVEPVRKPDAWFRSEKHLAWLRTLPPLDVGGEGQTEVDHLRIGTDACTGEKASDFFGLPLTAYGHRRRHSIGEATFYASIGVHDRIGLALSYAERSPCERTRKVAAAVLAGKPWMEAFGG